jgi:hypothetical protein
MVINPHNTQNFFTVPPAPSVAHGVGRTGVESIAGKSARHHQSSLPLDIYMHKKYKHGRWYRDSSQVFFMSQRRNFDEPESCSGIPMAVGCPEEIQGIFDAPDVLG